MMGLDPSDMPRVPHVVLGEEAFGMVSRFSCSIAVRIRLAILKTGLRLVAYCQFMHYFACQPYRAFQTIYKEPGSG
jgi:hypothetical protein